MPRQAEDTRAKGIEPMGSLCELSDQELLEGIRKASERHFNELYNRYFKRIYAFVHGRLRNHADAEEITQETFVSVFRSIENYRGQASLLSWIFGIAKNLSNNSIRRAQNQRQKFDSVEPEHFVPNPSLGACAPDDELHMQRYVQTIREQLESLAEWQRGVFEMRHFENLSIPEIARRTDRSNDAIRSSLYRIKRMMIESAELDGGGRNL
ncbi:MAG: RNA polymerase sigma factor [Deltaproteobacteria bacterium]|nr:RNA polymerase sigma factor [Deltaproteobacteria bacterium]MBW2385898.1 RNA polymerase sigma factor [Deltaproteobacteria bacterium]MBW2697645.1 RNA polymerase sigma factor [Deltaproteobacteria bacterium]